MISLMYHEQFGFRNLCEHNEITIISANRLHHSATVVMCEITVIPALIGNVAVGHR